MTYTQETEEKEILEGHGDILMKRKHPGEPDALRASHCMLGDFGKHHPAQDTDPRLDNEVSPKPNVEAPGQAAAG